MVDVLIRPRFDREVDAESVRRVALAALHHQAAAPQASLCVVITDDAEIQALNLQFRGIDAPTDVLSFGMQVEDSPDQNTSEASFVVAPEQTENVGIV